MKALGWQIHVEGGWVALIVGCVAVFCYSCDKLSKVVCFISQRLNRPAADPNRLGKFLNSNIFPNISEERLLLRI